jgi:cytochrome c biogenesis protein CcmG/thiol:disulfide interchange protein DsbE
LAVLVIRRVYMPLLVSLACAAVVALFVFGVLALGTNRTLDQDLAEGRHPFAPAATRMLPVLSGAGKRSVAQYHGHVVMLNFWASWCPPCHHEAPLVERAQRSLTPYGATVLGVTYEDAASDSEGFVHEYRLTFPILRDVTGEFAHTYGTEALPETFIINRSGRVMAISRGEIDTEFVHEAVALAAREPAPVAPGVAGA